jgi:hypothetical protein
MTKDDYWIVRTSLVPEGVTVTVTEGAQFSFGILHHLR